MLSEQLAHLPGYSLHLQNALRQAYHLFGSASPPTPEFANSMLQQTLRTKLSEPGVSYAHFPPNEDIRASSFCLKARVVPVPDTGMGRTAVHGIIFEESNVCEGTKAARMRWDAMRAATNCSPQFPKLELTEIPYPSLKQQRFPHWPPGLC